MEQKNENKLSFLSSLKLDEKKKELSAIFAEAKTQQKKPQTEEKAKAAEEKPKAEPKAERGTYDAFIAQSRYQERPPLTSAQILALKADLDAMPAQEKTEYIKLACDRATERLDTVFALYSDLEKAFYLAETNEDRKRIAELMHDVSCNILPIPVVFRGAVGVTVLAIDTFRVESRTSNATHHKQSLHMTKVLQEYIAELLARLDSIRSQLDHQIYCRLGDYYEDLDGVLGAEADWFQTYSGEPLKRTAFDTADANRRFKQGYDSFRFYKDITAGKYDRWQKRCCASVARNHFDCCEGDEKTDTAEIVLLAEDHNSHYATRILCDLKQALKEEGCLNGGGSFSGALGKKLQAIREGMKEKPQKPQVKNGRMMFASLLCVILTVVMWAIPADGREWLSRIGMMQLPVILIPAFITGYIAAGKKMAVNCLGMGMLAFLANIFLEHLLGLYAVTHNKVFFTIAMALCLYQFVQLADKLATVAAARYRSQMNALREKYAEELKTVEDYVKQLKATCEKSASRELAAYYTAALEQVTALKKEME